MDKHFVDTNIFLRYLTDDVPDQAQQVDQLLRRAKQGEIELHTSVLIIAEIVWTLETYYRLAPIEVQDRIMAILNTPGLRVEHGELVAKAMILYADANIDFVDVFNGMWMQEHGLASAITFNTKHFRRVPGVIAQIP
jgi:predicted nucleic-acid-binding protein